MLLLGLVEDATRCCKGVAFPRRGGLGELCKLAARFAVDLSRGINQLIAFTIKVGIWRSEARCRPDGMAEHGTAKMADTGGAVKRLPHGVVRS